MDRSKLKLAQVALLLPLAVMTLLGACQQSSMLQHYSVNPRSSWQAIIVLDQESSSVGQWNTQINNISGRSTDSNDGVVGNETNLVAAIGRQTKDTLPQTTAEGADHEPIGPALGSNETQETSKLPGVDLARNVTWDYNKWFFPDGRPRFTESINQTANYFRLAVEEGKFHDFTKVNVPLQMVQDYINNHGKRRLEREWQKCQRKATNPTNGTAWAFIQKNLDVTHCANLAQRKFVVGRYSCPFEAGNRLHKYMNHFLWAMVTGRTFLSGYWDRKACLDEEEELPPNFCAYGVGSKSSCDTVLGLNAWVPQWDYWNDVLGLLPSLVVRVNGLGHPHDSLGRPYDQDGAPRVLRVGQQHLLTTAMYLEASHSRDQLLGNDTNREYTRQLLSHGHHFLYGMLFECLFTLQPSALPDPSVVADSKVYQTWMLHSRHPSNKVDGSYIHPEVTCMEQQVEHIQPPCVVYLMSDRPKSLDALRRVLPLYNCVPILANHSRDKSFSSEHGVFAGLGYFQDLALARNARHGFIAPHLQQRKGKGIRTSSGLVRSIIEFRRRLEGYFPIAIHQCTHPLQKHDYTTVLATLDG